MENNQTPMETVTQTTPVVPPTPNKPKSTLAKKLMLSALVVVAAGLVTVGITNPELFRAAILEQSAPAGVSKLYIPNYTAGPTDSGLIAIKVKQEVSSLTGTPTTLGCGAVSTALAGPLTVTALGSEITDTNDIRIQIKSGTNATFDVTKLSLTLGGTASAKASGTVTYSLDGKTLIIDVTSPFVAGENLSIAGLSLVGGACVGGPSGAKALQWSVDGGTTYNNGFASTNVTVTKTATATPAAEVSTLVSEKLVSLEFKLKWAPATAMVMNENSIVFDADTLFKTADLKSVNTSVPGEAIISFFTSNAVTVEPSAVRPLVKLAVQLSAPAGSREVALEVTGLDVIKEVSVDGSLNYESSTNFTAIDTGKITFATQDKLRVLSTESIDSTHVLVRFSDLLQNTGVFGDYSFDGGLTASAVTSGYSSGYDQKTVIVTTDPQTPGTPYTLTVSGTVVKGNTQAGLDPNYTKARLFGFGNMPTALSSFAVTKAESTAADKIKLTFSEAVASGSVIKEGFSVDVVNGGALTILAADVTGNQVTLTLNPAPPLPADKTAIVTVNVTDKPVRRASDNAILGINKATVAGFGATTDLALVNVEVVDKKTLMVNFNANLVQASVAPAKFSVNPGSLTPIAADIQPGFQKVKLTMASDLAVGVYTLTADTGPTGILPYGLTGKFLIPYASVFAIAQAPSAQSAVKLESIDVNSSTMLTLHFSGALQGSSVTPVNIGIEKFLPGPAANLTLVSATLKDAQTVEVVTAQQESDVNYFVSMKGVKDAQGLPLGNNRVLNFLGFKVSAVVIRSVSPISVTNDAEKVLAVLGENLDTVSTARLGTTVVQISDKTAGALSLTIPSGFTAGVYDLNLVSESGQTFTLANALTVQVSIEPMQIISAESRSIPNRVAPDGTTPVTFWVLVKDPTALNQISSVTIDLEQIGGRRAQEMAKDSGTQKQFSQFYTYRTTVTANTPTATEPVRLPVEVRKGTEVVRGTVEIMVTRNVLRSVPPVIDQAYANPSTMVPDGEAKGKISARITDPDGAGTIKSVVADLGELGVGFVTLVPIGEAAGLATQLTGSFISEEFSVAKMTPEKAYTVTVTAQDETGATATKTLTLTVSTAQNAPKFDKARSYIGPRKSVPRDGKTTFGLHAMVSDPDGVNDIESVTAFFGTSGLAPVAFTRDPSVTAESIAKSALYNSGEISVPSITPLGMQDVELVAVDKAGGTANLVLQFEVTDKDTLGEKPFINSAKAYTAPKIALNDGKTPITLYAFVRDDDENLESVVANLANLGQIGPELPADFGEVGAPAPSAGGEGCSGSAGIVCMTPGFKEGNLGQWFSVSGVTVSKDVAPSDQPYKIEVIATDASGNVTRGQIPVSVRDSLNVTADKTPPSVIAAVPVGSGSIEVLFSKSLDSLTVSGSGSNFTITSSQDVSQKLNVFGSTIDASGRVVTVTTDAQKPGANYALSVSSKVTDSAGIPMVSGRSSQSSFRGFEDSDRAPVVDFIGATDGETVQIDFLGNLRPTSVKLGESAKGGDFGIKVEEVDSGQSLAVKAVRFVESGKSLEVKTDMQKSSTRYRVTISNVASAAGVQTKGPITKFFKSINIKSVQKAAVASGADLNGDGKVDFIDFTMFSAVYGQAISQVPVDSGLAGGQGLSPIVPPPDSTVTHTSEPTGN